jgi:hypothetical protein
VWSRFIDWLGIAWCIPAIDEHMLLEWKHLAIGKFKKNAFLLLYYGIYELSGYC